MVECNVELNGKTILAKPGNMKITEKPDIALMEQILKERESQ